MFRAISFRKFMEQVEERLKSYSQDTLREIITVWAKKTPPARRAEFLAMLVPPLPGGKKPAPDKELLDEIEALAERVENNDYCTGWGCDNELREERDWEDESWKDEVDDLFARAYDALLNGHYKLAEQAYARLFAILAMGEEPGHLPGHPDPAEMLATDLEEARLCYLRAVYLAAPPAQRPARLLEAIRESRYWTGGRVSLQKIIDAGPAPLPGYSQFLASWIGLLQKTGTNHDLLREAVIDPTPKGGDLRGYNPDSLLFWARKRHELPARAQPCRAITRLSVGADEPGD